MGKRSAEREQYLADVLTTAVEGGMTYWATGKDYRHPADSPAATTVTVRDLFDATEPWHVVTIDTVAAGLALLGKLRADGVGWVHGYGDVLLSSRTNGEDGDYDAGDADVIVQLGIFGEVVYG